MTTKTEDDREPGLETGEVMNGRIIFRTDGNWVAASELDLAELVMTMETGDRDHIIYWGNQVDRADIDHLRNILKTQRGIIRHDPHA